MLNTIDLKNLKFPYQCTICEHDINRDDNYFALTFLETKELIMVHINCIPEEDAGEFDSSFYNGLKDRMLTMNMTGKLMPISLGFVVNDKTVQKLKDSNYLAVEIAEKIIEFVYMFEDTITDIVYYEKEEGLAPITEISFMIYILNLNNLSKIKYDLVLFGESETEDDLQKRIELTIKQFSNLKTLKVSLSKKDILKFKNNINRGMDNTIDFHENIRINEQLEDFNESARDKISRDLMEL